MKNVIEALSTIGITRQTYSRSPYHMGHFVLLARFRYCLATYERDKVFALSGPASNVLKHEKVVEVIPDCSKPVYNAFKPLAWGYINKQKNLDIICYASFVNHLGISSQVLCWSYHEPGLFVLSKRRTLEAYQNSMYRYCGDLKLDTELLFSSELTHNRLRLNGFQFDMVSIVGGAASKPQDLRLKPLTSSLSDLLQQWIIISEFCSPIYGQKIKRAFRRTLLTDVVGDKRWEDKVYLAHTLTGAGGDTPSNDNTDSILDDPISLLVERLEPTENGGKMSLEDQLKYRAKFGRRVSNGLP